MAILETAANRPRLAASLLESGLLDRMLAALQSCRASGSAAPEHNMVRGSHCLACLACRHHARTRELGVWDDALQVTPEQVERRLFVMLAQLVFELEGLPLPAPEAASLQQEAARLHAELQSAEQLMGRPGGAGAAAAVQAMQQRALPSARQVAAVLLRSWRRPEQQQEDALELAQAAAARSCAYLRCANLGGRGGAAAGEGEGSLRCR